jgi:uncharacterized damage-inducible protein DinB
MADSDRGDKRPPRIFADEKTTLLAFLDYLRDSVAYKASGLPDEQARRQMVPSGTSLLGLLKHLTGAERTWFAYSFAGQDTDQDDHLAPEDTIASVVAGYRQAAASSNELVAGAGLEQRAVRARRDAEPPTLRWILVHMIEETARHAGHADILREQIDGSVGR